MTHICDPVKNRWTNQDNKILNQMLLNGYSNEEIGEALNRTDKAVAQHINVLKNGRPDQPKNTKNKKINISVDVMPYTEASWAPCITGVTFDWAWRVSTANDENNCVGVANGSRQQAENKAKVVTKRLADILGGKASLNGVALNKKISLLEQASG